MIDAGLWIAYIMFILALAGMAVFSLINMLSDIKKAKGTLVGIGILIVLFVVSYAISGSEVLPKYEQLGIDSGSSKMIGAWLILLYIVGVSTFALAVVSEFRKLFMK
jgi:hypothetical protein